MATIIDVVNEWTNRRNKKPLSAWDINHPGMQLVPLKNNSSQIIGSGLRNATLEKWASMKLSQNVSTDGRKWHCGGSNTECYYFSEFPNRFEVALRVGSKLANKYVGGATALYNLMITWQQTLNAKNTTTYVWEADITPFGTVRLKLEMNKKETDAFICERMEELIQVTQNPMNNAKSQNGSKRLNHGATDTYPRLEDLQDF